MEFISNVVRIFEGAFLFSQVLLALERIEQDDELTYEVFIILSWYHALLYLLR